MIKLHLDTDKQTVGVPMVFLRITDNNVDTLSVTVTSGGAPFDLTGYTVAFEGIGPKGNRIIDSSGKITDATSGKFSYTTAAALAQSQGHYQLAYFSLTKGSARTTTGNLNLFVYNSVPDGINPDDYIEPYNELIEKLNSAFTTATQNAQKKVADLETTTNDVTKRVTDNANNQIESVTNTAEGKSQEVSENAKKQVDSLNDQVDVLGNKIADYISGQTIAFEDFQS
ncbi:phage baseplate upper protein [Levilactobacillus namurensis]|uniref:phage baseplate upper protein n=1 Tax=Levilactobacillus namurensis TaxID=380393 RepID=UPI002230877B|nr:phage baseplate upper protein [Levilactobacillus namurensis]MCW3778516.1 phage baseplate upper protein [Levilactobacillus namurensis]MDT7019563.1 phage baseplate upper protein [Levilactobacillus namurensis]WNN65849.1 phage baseplate upper protein [Levilactobacillus namurensis]